MGFTVGIPSCSLEPKKRCASAENCEVASNMGMHDDGPVSSEGKNELNFPFGPMITKTHGMQ